MKKWKGNKLLSVREAVEFHGALLECAGFLLEHYSMDGEERYYRFPNSRYLLRVGPHALRSVAKDQWQHLSITNISVSDTTTYGKGKIPYRREKIEQLTARGIGFYMIKAGKAKIAQKSPFE